MGESRSAHNVTDTRFALPGGEGPWEFAHALLFTGHMIDQAERKDARFPASAEEKAREAIHATIATIEWGRPGTTVGLAGGASGGDLLFHECCEQMGVATRVMLALPPDQFEAWSVAPAGQRWVGRFHALLDKAGVGVHVMRSGDGLLEGATDNIWQRANLWMIEEAVRLASERALLALWDGKAGDGPGGTAHFLEIARAFGIRVLPPIAIGSALEGEGESA